MPNLRIFSVTNLSFNAIRENKISAKISEFTVSAKISEFTVPSNDSLQLCPF